MRKLCVWKVLAVLFLLPTSALADVGTLQCLVQKRLPAPSHEVLVTGQFGDQDFAFKISVDGKPVADPQGPPKPVPCVATS